MTIEESNNLMLKTIARIQVNTLIIEIESLTPEQLKNTSILEAYKDSLNNALGFYEFDILHELNNEKQTQLKKLKEKIQLKILSLELEEISSHKPPVIIKHTDTN